MLLVPNTTSRDRRMVTRTATSISNSRARITNADSPDLLAHEPRRSRFILPPRNENLSQKSIERLLDALFLRTTGILLIPQCRNKPSEDQQRPLRRIFRSSRCNEHGWSLGPECRKLDGGLCVEDKRRSCDVGEITPDRGYGLFFGTAWMIRLGLLRVQMAVT